MRIIDKFAELLLVLLFTTMLVVGGMQVFNRFLLNYSLSWSEELQKFAFIWLVFIAIPVAYRRHAHLRVDGLISKFPSNFRLGMAWAIQLLWLALGVFLMTLTWKLMQIAKFQVSAGLGISMAWVYSGMVVGGAYLVLSVLSQCRQQVQDFTKENSCS